MRCARTGLVVVLAAVLAALAACGPAGDADPGLEPLVAPPAIAEEGVLRVGVDLDYPPYGGVDKGREAGIDIDVASALAAELGLVLELVEVPSVEASAALQAGDVDIVMSVPFTEAAVQGASFAGFYIETAPVLFASVETSITPERLGGHDIAVQEGSESFWALAYTLGEEALIVTDTLREGFEAFEAGDADVVAGDALVCAYLARDFDGIAFGAQLEPATPIGIVVSPDAVELERVVRAALDAMAADGVLDAIRTKWVDDLPKLNLPPDDEE